MQKRSPVDVETDLESLWTYVPCPTLVVDQAGVVRASSASAQSLLPAAIPGSRVEDTAGWLSQAHDLLVQPSSAPDGQGLSFVSGCVGGRKFDAHPAMLPGGEVAWSLVEDSGQVLRVKGTQLRPERQFAQAGIELIGSTSPAADAEVILDVVDSLRELGLDWVGPDYPPPPADVRSWPVEVDLGQTAPK